MMHDAWKFHGPKRPQRREQYLFRQWSIEFSALLSILWIVLSLGIFHNHCSLSHYFINYNEVLRSKIGRHR